MKVLLVNQYFPPDTSATASVWSALTEELAGREHSVTVLAGRPSYLPEHSFRWRPLRRDVVEGLTVERVGSTAFARDKMFGRLLNYCTFIILAAIRAIVSKKHDLVVVGTDPPLAVLVGLLAAKGRPVVCSLQDLHPQVAVAAGMIRATWLTRAWDRVNLAALKRCAKVICLGDRMLEVLREKGVARERLLVIPNGAEAPRGSPNSGVVERLRGDASFVVMYAGNIGVGVAWRTLLEASRGFPAGVKLLFVGDGGEVETLRALGGEVVPFLPSEHLPAVMAAGDLHVVSMKREMVGFMLPSKLYSTLMHGRPVLALAPEGSDVAELVRSTRSGWVADPDDPEDVVRIVKEVHRRPGQLHEAGLAAALAGRHFNRADCTARVADVIEQQEDGVGLPRGMSPG